MSVFSSYISLRTITLSPHPHQRHTTYSKRHCKNHIHVYTRNATIYAAARIVEITNIHQPLLQPPPAPNPLPHPPNSISSNVKILSEHMRACKPLFPSLQTISTNTHHPVYNTWFIYNSLSYATASSNYV